MKVLMNRSVLAVMALCLMLNTIPAMAKPLNNAGLDRHFVTSVSQGNTGEVMTGRLALRKSRDPQVRAIAQHMIADHTKANEALKHVAHQNGFGFKPSVAGADRSNYNTLSRMNGSRFDQAFLSSELKNHQKTISLFRQEIESGHNNEIRDYAADFLSTIQDHKDMLQTAENSRKH